VRRAGTIIFCLSVILWALTYWPKLSDERVAEIAADTERAVQADWTSIEPWNTWPAVLGDMSFGPRVEDHRAEIDELAEKAVAAEQLRQSYAGRLGHLIEPAIQPLGFDWKIGVGLVGSFAAREVFVSTMGIVYSVGDAEDDTAPLADAMRADTYPNGRPVWSPLVAATLLVWFVIAMQCMSTVAIVKRETGKWSWAIGQLVYMNALAYVLCLAVFQIGRLIV
jgi:ferrous iron transport protein B